MELRSFVYNNSRNCSCSRNSVFSSPSGIPRLKVSSDWRSEDTDYDFLPALLCSFQKPMCHGSTGFDCSPMDWMTSESLVVPLWPWGPAETIGATSPATRSKAGTLAQDSGEGRAPGRQSIHFLFGSFLVLLTEKQEQQQRRHTDLKVERFFFF